MEKHIKEYLDSWVEKYEHLLAQYYPAHGSAGFTERNLTVNFAKVIEEASAGTFTWYEAPVDEKTEGKHHQHLDAVIFEQDKNTLYMVEAKRFSTLKSKMPAVGRDIKRVCSQKNIVTVTKELKKKKSSDFSTVYGVIIADVWTTKILPKSGTNDATKHNIFEAFKAGTFIEDFAERLEIEPDFTSKYIVKSYARRLDFEAESDYNYNLVALIFKIK